jgi:tetratricopeptide (TPR) repeat protein
MLRALAVTYFRMDELEEARAAAVESNRIANVDPVLGTFERARCLSTLGYAEYRFGRYREARSAYEGSLSLFREVVSEEHPMLQGFYYNLACVQALDGGDEEALASLRKSIGAGFSSEIMLSDPDLDSLRGTPEFEEMLRVVERRRAG